MSFARKYIYYYMLQPRQPLRPVDLIQPLQSRVGPDADAALPQLMSTSLRSDNDAVEDITHRPKHVWTKLMTSEELVAERQERRRQRGWQVDFEDYQTPFQQNIANRLNRIKIEEAAAAEYKKKTAKRK
jgi:hypothetical protein